MKRDAAFYESQFRNRPAVPDHQRILARWDSASDEARAGLRNWQDLRYGPHRLQTLDIYAPQGECRAAVMFIHGGYWQGLDKREHGFVAQALARVGVATVLPNYALCPEVSIAEIVRQMLAASAWLYRNGPDYGIPRERLYVSGHSAGGHLTAMMMAALWPGYAQDLPARLFQGGLAISGLYDLREIVRVPSVNANAKLDDRSAVPVSPIFLPPATDAPLFLAAGADELPPFRRQQRAFAKHWSGVLAEERLCAGENHYSILLQFTDPASELVGMVERMIERA